MQPSFLALLLFQLLFMGNVIYLGEFLIRKEISLFLTSNSKNFLTLHQFCAAFYHQRVKLKDGALWELLQIFNQKLKPTLYRNRYRLVACDGSVADIFRDEKDTETYFEPNSKSPRGFNQIHINALYSILDKQFLDVLVQPARKRNEYSAFCEMVDWVKNNCPTIYMKPHTVT